MTNEQRVSLAIELDDLYDSLYEAECQAREVHTLAHRAGNTFAMEKLLEIHNSLQTHTGTLVELVHQLKEETP
jgi:hypothetical protein